MSNEFNVTAERQGTPEQLAQWAEMDLQHEEAKAARAAYRQQKADEFVQLSER